MNRSWRYAFFFVALGFFLNGATTLADEPPPVFMTEWGSLGEAESQFGYWHFGIAVDGADAVYVADTAYHRIQKFDSSGTFLRMWGWGVQDGSWEFQHCASGCQAGISGDDVGQLNNPHSLAASGFGSIFVTDTHNNRIVEFDVDGNFQNQWGSWCSVYESGYDGCDGRFQQPWGVAVDPGGNVFVADSFNYRIQMFDNNGTLITKWGTPGSGPGQFDQPVYVAVDEAGSVFVADNFNDRIQKFTLAEPCPAGTSQVVDYPQGVPHPVAGVCFVKEWGWFGSSVGEFAGPGGIALDERGDLYVADFDPQAWDSNDRIQKFDGEGNFITEWGSYGHGEGEFWNPSDVAVDDRGDVFVLDLYNNRIQKFGFTAEQRIESLAEDIEELATAGYLDFGEANALTVKLESALKSVDKGNDISATNQIQAFINQVDAFVQTDKLTSGQGAELVAAAQNIVDQLQED